MLGLRFRVPPSAFRVCPVITSFKVGHFTCHTLEAGRQHLDGGSMFGIVPKPLWERRIAPDDRNRIPLAMRCLLIEHDDGLVLVDTGLGNKADAKFMDLYGVENAGAGGRTALEDALAALGHRPDDVRWVIDSHLHFDHAGGNTWRDPSGAIRPTFPRARYVVQRGEREWASHTNERTRGSYVAADFTGIDFTLLDGDTDVLPGIRCFLTPGHTPFHQSVRVDSRGATACFLGDVVPTTAHLPLPWIMGYDVEPLRTLESKRSLYRSAVAEGWLCVFGHDPVTAAARLVPEGKGLGLVAAMPAG